jgi:hypothetical protein
LRTAMRGTDTRPVFAPRPPATERIIPLVLVLMGAGRFLTFY